MSYSSSVTALTPSPMDPVEQLRQRGLASWGGVLAIRVYQQTLSRVVPPQCRYSPSCSQYGIEAIERFGLIDGSRLTLNRIGRCRPPYGGSDPVPESLPWLQASAKALGTEATRIPAKQIPRQDLTLVGDRKAQFSFENFHHSFKLMLAYPKDREFFTHQEFQEKIAEFYERVLRIEQYAIDFRVDKVSAGVINDEYVCRFEGSTSGDLLEYQIDEVVNLIIAQLEAFFIIVQQGEFRPLYFEVDGQVVIEPKADDRVLPPGYAADNNYWHYTSDDSAWDLYWGSYIVEDLVNLLVEASGGIIDGMSSGLGATAPEIGDVVGVAPGQSDDPGVLDGVGDLLDNAGEAVGDIVSGVGETAAGCVDGCDLAGCDPFSG